MAILHAFDHFPKTLYYKEESREFIGIMGLFILFFKRLVFVFIFLLFFFQVEAFQIRFPDEELASESVLPLIVPTRVVLNRNISLKYKVEIELGGSFGLDEPFYFPVYGLGGIAFHFTEKHAVSITGVYFPPLRSLSGKDLAEGKGLKEGKAFDPLKAPYPNMMSFLNYQYTPYYGKLSLSKNWVMNLSIYGFVGSGILVFNHSEVTAVGNLGIGQKLYFNKWFGIRGDLGFYGYYGPATAKLDLGSSVEGIRYDQIEPKNKRLIINAIVNVGLIFLI